MRHSRALCLCDGMVNKSEFFIYVTVYCVIVAGVAIIILLYEFIINTVHAKFGT